MKLLIKHLPAAMLCIALLTGCDGGRGGHEPTVDNPGESSGQKPAIKLSFTLHSTTITEVSIHKTSAKLEDANASELFGADGQAASDMIEGIPTIKETKYNAKFYHDGTFHLVAENITPEEYRPSSFGMKDNFESWETSVVTRQGREISMGKQGKVIYDEDRDFPNLKPELDNLKKSIMENKNASSDPLFSTQRKAMDAQLGVSPGSPSALKTIEAYKEAGAQLEKLEGHSSLIRITSDLDNPKFQALITNSSGVLARGLDTESKSVFNASMKGHTASVYYSAKEDQVLSMNSFDSRGHLKKKTYYEYTAEGSEGTSTFSDKELSRRIPTTSYTELYFMGGDQRARRFVNSTWITNFEIETHLTNKED